MSGGPSSCMGNCYVKRGERKTVYGDMNNLYGWSMLQYSPTGDFREINVTRNSAKTILKTPDNDEYVFLIECDLDCPSSIHKKIVIFLPDEKTIKVEDFSPYMKKMNRKNKNLRKID